MKKADKYILLGIVFAIVISSIGIYIYQSFFTTPATAATITQNGKVIRTIFLDEVKQPYDFTIATDDGGYNTIHVEKGSIRFIHANCPDQICVKAGGLSVANDIAACLPHRLLIEISGDRKDDIDTLSH